jgi:hypothetical protein
VPAAIAPPGYEQNDEFYIRRLELPYMAGTKS